MNKAIQIVCFSLSMLTALVSTDSLLRAQLTQSFSPSHDSFVKLTSPASNYGTNGKLKLWSGKFESYLKFNVSGITGSVQSAKLQLYVIDDGNGGSDDGGAIYSVSNNDQNGSPWTESGITANSAPTIGGAPLSSLGAVTAGSTVEFDVTAAITGDGTYSFGIKNASTDQVWYSSKDNTSSNEPNPLLVIATGGGGGGNQSPLAVDDNAATNEDTAVVIPVLANDSDPDGTLDPSTVTIGAAPANGSASVNTATGDVTYTPNANYYGNDSFTYTVKDNLGAVSNAATVSVAIASVNDPPVANNDNAATSQDVAVAIDVTANDTDIDGTVQANTVSLGGLPANGTASVNATTGIVTYTPNTGFTGNDSFTYTVADNQGATSNIATVSVAVSAGGGSLSFSPSHDSYVKLTDPTLNKGTDTKVKLQGGKFEGYFKFNVSGITGSVQNAKLQLYVIDDGNGGSDDGGAIYSVSNNDQNGSPWTESGITANNAPTIGGAPLSSLGAVTAGSTVEVDVTAAITGDGTYSFGIKNASTDQVWYSSKDNTNSNEPNPLLLITTGGGGGNQSPVANNDAAGTGQNLAVAIDVLANDSDPDGTLNPASVTVSSAPANGATSVNPANGKITYTPDTGFTGSDTFDYTVDDNLGLTSNRALVTVSVQGNTSPVAVNDNFVAVRNTATPMNVTLNDTDNESNLDPSTVNVVTAPAYGQTTVGANGIVTYTPNAGYNGTDQFTYTVMDSLGALSNQATVDVFVNIPPTANNDAAATIDNIAVQIDVTANDSDSDGAINKTSVILTSPATNGGVIFNSATALVTYTPNPNYTGSDSFTYTVDDDKGTTSNQATVTVTVSQGNQPPVANNDMASENEGTPVAIDVTANDTDADGSIDPATLAIVTQPANGSAAVNAGKIDYSSNAGFSGQDTFTYTVQDNEGALSNQATVTVNVNARPVAVADADTTNKTAPVTIVVTANDYDDGLLVFSSLQIASGPANGWVTIDANNGAITYTPVNTFLGVDTFTYTIQDNAGLASDPGTVTVSVQSAGGANLPPVAVDDNASMVYWTTTAATVDINVVANDYDPDGSIVPGTETVFNFPANGVILAAVAPRKSQLVAEGAAQSSPGVLTYQPNANFIGTDTFTYKVQDNSGALSNLATVTIQVMPNSPTNLTAADVGNGVSLSWTNVPNITRYRVYRNETFNGNYELVADLSNLTSGQYLDQNVSNGTDMFGQLIGYDKAGAQAFSYNSPAREIAAAPSPLAPGFNAQHNGNIAWSTFYTAGASDMTGWVYQYDGANRITGGNYGKVAGSSWVDDSSYDLTNITYDLSGNITAMTRNKQDGTSTFMTYNYPNKTNQLDYVANLNAQAAGNYSYDANGNLIKDKAKLGNAAMTYDYRNLPVTVPANGNAINFEYNPRGQRAMKNNTIYVRDKDDKTIAVYRKDASGVPQLLYFNIWGLDLLGQKLPN